LAEKLKQHGENTLEINDNVINAHDCIFNGILSRHDSNATFM